MPRTTEDEKTQQEKLEESLLETLTELGGQRIKTDALVQEGDKLTLPRDMSPEEGIAYLSAYVAQNEQTYSYDRTYRYRPWDGAHAVQSALKRLYGTMGIQRGRAGSFFFAGTPPQTHSIQVGPNRTEHIPWGEIEAPFIGGSIHLGSRQHPELGLLFRVEVEAQKKHAAAVEGLFVVIQRELEENSIYRGQAIDGQEDAEFLDLAGVDANKVIYSDQVLTQLDANVWSLLEHSDLMRELDIPLKRAILLKGPHGTGKTLAGFLTAKTATGHGWTFIYCRPGKDDLTQVLATARLYQPCVVFFEDVDTVVGADEPITLLLDAFDGITAKGTEIVAVLTTNHPEKVHRAMVRPGRLDAMIHVGELDAGGIERMIAAVVPARLIGELDYDAIAEAMDGFLPAFVKEAVDRSMRYSIARNSGPPDVLSTEDFVAAAEGLRPQLDLMEAASEGSPADRLGEALKDHVRAAVDGAQIVDRDDEEMFVVKQPGNGQRVA